MADPDPAVALPGGLLTVTPDGQATLLGGWSPTSGQFHFPLAPVCPYSGADDVEAVDLSGRGTLFGWTAVTTAPPGYGGPVPYGFGIVELSVERLRIVTRLTVADPTRLRFGQPMHLVAETIRSADDGSELVAWAFAPDEARAP